MNIYVLLVFWFSIRLTLFRPYKVKVKYQHLIVNKESERDVVGRIYGK